MKKISLIALLFLAILLLENCKKDTVIASATSTYLMIANIKDTSWYTDTVTATVQYNAATKNKTFTCTGFSVQKEITFSVTKANASNSSGFPLGTYTVDANSNPYMAFLTPKTIDDGSPVYTPNGIVAPGSGTVVVSAVDSVKNVINGTFNFTTLKNNYDSSGNIISVTVATVSAGGFNNVPYSFTSN